MTDGIIQEVFNKEIKRISSFNNVVYRNLDVIDLYAKVQQELIEKIKQELNKPGCNSYCKMHRKRLIGDNQE